MKRVFALGVVAIVLMSMLAAAAPGDVIEEQIGIDPKDIPQDLEAAKEDYLKKNWEEVIVSNAVLGRIHAFFTKISPVFNILFGQPYSLSPALFFIVLLWIYLITKIDSALHAFGILNRPSQLAIAIGAGIILAQLNVLAGIAAGLSKIIFAPEAWWMRLVAILIATIILVVMHFLINKGIWMIKESRAQKVSAGMRNKVSKFDAFLKGVDQASRLKDN